MKGVTFTGGVHPDCEKEPTASSPIRDSVPPDKVVLHMSQHVGAACRPVVSKGDKVKIGQLVGEAAGFVSSPVHSSVSGKVIAVDHEPHPLGQESPAVVVENDGNDDWELMEPIPDPLSRTPEELKARIRDAGLVGLGGAAFPTHVKLSPPKNKRIDKMLFNGAECEPYLTADDRIMREEPQRVFIGMQLVAHILGLEGGTICIEANKPEAIKSMAEASKDHPGFPVQPLVVKYPQGGEKQLIEAVLQREVPSGGLPMDCGVMVFNVSTCAAIYDAVYKGIPLVSRITTVTGRAVKNPANLRIRLGTMVRNLLDQCGGFIRKPGKIILGGPMMGIASHSMDVPALKSVGGIFVQPADEVLDGAFGPCIRCGLCIGACPMKLVPNELSNYAEREMWEELESRDLMDCIECGCCTYACPAYRPIIQFVRAGKAVIHARKS